MTLGKGYGPRKVTQTDTGNQTVAAGLRLVELGPGRDVLGIKGGGGVEPAEASLLEKRPVRGVGKRHREGGRSSERRQRDASERKGFCC